MLGQWDWDVYNVNELTWVMWTHVTHGLMMTHVTHGLMIDDGSRYLTTTQDTETRGHMPPRLLRREPTQVSTSEQHGARPKCQYLLFFTFQYSLLTWLICTFWCYQYWLYSVHWSDAWCLMSDCDDGPQLSHSALVWGLMPDVWCDDDGTRLVLWSECWLGLSAWLWCLRAGCLTSPPPPSVPTDQTQYCPISHNYPYQGPSTLNCF